MDTKGDLPRRYVPHISVKPTGSIRRLAAFSILTAGMAVTTMATVAGVNEAAPIEAVEVQETSVPYYMTEEYQEMKCKEEAEKKAEADALRESIEEYGREQEKKAEEDFKALQEYYQGEYDIYAYEAEELPYPFNTVSQDWGAEDIEGFVEYEIPEEYRGEGGYFPRTMQIFLWCICRDMGFNYPTAVAMIEKESGYQWDCVGEAKDSGYFQVVEKYHTERIERLDVTDILNPYQNSLVAIDYAVELLDKYDGSYRKALTAYNYGPEGAYKYFFSAGVDANPYARDVLKRAERIREELSGAAED